VNLLETHCLPVSFLALVHSERWNHFMIRLRRKPNPEDQVIVVPPEENVDMVLPEPATTPSPTLKLAVWVRETDTELIKKDFQMTIRANVTNLTVREASMLLMVCNVQALRDGLDVTLYLSIEFLTALLTRSGSLRPEDIKEERVRQTCLLSDLIMSTFRGEWTQMGERVRILDREVLEAISASGWLPDKRTYNSWVQHWQPGKWLSVRIVPLDTLLNRSGSSEPYSGYCKGYGEGSSRGAKKTPYDYELDGEDYAEPKPPEFNLLEVQAYQRILNALEANRTRRTQGSQ
jgi:hypothetical protein